MVDHLHIQFKVRQDLKAANVISDKSKVKKTEKHLQIFNLQTTNIDKIISSKTNI